MEPRADPKKIRVGVNGYGVIGKRVAAAVARQEDMYKNRRANLSVVVGSIVVFAVSLWSLITQSPS